MTTVNITSAPYNAVADGHYLDAKFTITATLKALHSPVVGTWPDASVVGNFIVVGNAGGSGPNGGSPLLTTIAGWTDTQNITLTDAAVMTLPLVDTSRDTFLVSWGATNNSAAFALLQTNFPGGDVTLTIPAGIYLISSGQFEGIGNGIKTLTVNATGATICGGTFKIGAAAQFLPANHMARTAAVSSGATSVTCLTPAEASRFTVGGYALMTGECIQEGGYPSNHFRYEYVKISSVNASTGIVGFSTTPLTKSYRADWPVFDTDAPDYGGPATLYAFDPKFDHTAVWNGVTVAHDAQFSASGRDATLNDCIFKGQNGPYPTMGSVVRWNRCTGALCFTEVDKYIPDTILTGCTFGGITCQSPNQRLTLDSTTISFSLSGTAGFTTIRNGCTIGTLKPSPTFYGYANELNVSDSVISNFGDVTTHGAGRFINDASGGTVGTGVNVAFSMANGVITVPSTWYASGWVQQWMIVGANIFWNDANVGTLGKFQILAVTQDASNTYVHTDWPGGFPNRTYGAGGLSMIVHPAPVARFSNVTGCPEVVDLSQAGAYGKPLYSYTKRTYDGTAASGRYWQMYGRFKYIKVTVTTAYTGVSGQCLATLGSGSNQTISMVDQSNAGAWSPVIDLKHTGVRTFDATANNYSVPVTWTGAQGSDSLPSQAAARWCAANFIMTMTDVSVECIADPTKGPAFTVEFITDQGSFGSNSFACNFV